MSSASESREPSGVVGRVREWLIGGAALTIPSLTATVLELVLDLPPNVPTPVDSAGPKPPVGGAIGVADARRGGS